MWHFGLFALRNTCCGNACFGAQVSLKYGTWYSERVILQFMYVGSSAGVTCLRYTMLMSSNKSETAVHCCDPFAFNNIHAWPYHFIFQAKHENNKKTLLFLSFIHNIGQLWKYLKGERFQLKAFRRGTLSVKMKYKRVRGGTMRGSLLAPQKTFWTPSPGSSMLICKMQVKIECWAGSSGEGRGGGGWGWRVIRAN